ncbi:MFS transporter [Klenkia sp. LSe6-5]|uniref:MFS transporter n=1 Tax=Klenkia sesuvii TaxID=3103137 RepID=A0ABU8DSG5_9ACTN
MSTATTPVPLRRDPAFLRFLAARTVAVAGAAVTGVALPLLVFRLSGSAFLTAAVSAVAVLPYLVFGLVAGALADRVDRRRLMLGCQAVAGTALATVPLAAALDVLTVGHVLAAAAVLFTAFVWFDAASFGALPRLVGRSRLPEANSLVFTSASVVDVSFPAVAGLLIALVGPAFALGLDVLSYLVAGLLIASIRVPLSDARRPPAAEGPGLLARTAGDIREGLVFLWQQPVVRALSLFGFGQSLSAGAVTGLLVVYGVDGLGLDPGSGLVGGLYVAVAAGGLIAGASLTPLSRRVPVGWITIAAYAANAVLLLALALTTVVVPALALLVAWSTASVLSIVNGITTRQRVTPDALQGRVNTTARMIAWGGAPVGALTGGAVAGATDVRTAFLVATVGVGLSAVLSTASPLRRRRLLPEGA